MTITADTILDSAAGTLLDRSHRTWSADDLLAYLNEFLRATAFVKPDFYVVQTAFIPVAGEQQVLPSDGVALIDIPRNTGGRVITQVSKDLLDEASRFWPAATQETVIEHYTVDPRNPRRFVLFPPSDGTGSLDIIYGATVPEVRYTAEEIDIPATYESAAIAFILSKCYAKNTKRQDLSKSAAYMQQWGQLLGLKSQAQIAASPKVSAEPGVT
jgi:hypothetical protein